MPTYKFHDTLTDAVWEDFMSITAADEFLAINPHIIRLPNGAPAIASSRGGDRVRIDNGFKEVLQKVGEKHPYTPLGERYGPKDTKTVKTREVLNKHRQKRKI